MEPPLERSTAAMIDGSLQSVALIFWIIDKENSLYADKLKNPCKEERVAKDPRIQLNAMTSMGINQSVYFHMVTYRRLPGVHLHQRPGSLFLLVHSDTTVEQTVNTGLPGLG